MLYVGPEVLMPLASAVAVVAGALLLFWRRVVAGLRSAARRVAGLFTRR
jgi:hypothetical protein